ncbi:Uncharacterised protein [Escherichia coli]|nr:Uncharacterised protein [Escherichia coli]
MQSLFITTAVTEVHQDNGSNLRVRLVQQIISVKNRQVFFHLIFS